MNEIIEKLTISDISEMQMKFNDLANLITKNFKNYNAAEALIFGMKEVIDKAVEHMGSQV